MIIKIANTEKSDKKVSFQMNIKGLPEELNGKKITLKADLAEENTLDEPLLVKPTESEVSTLSSSFNIYVPSESFEVYVFNL